MGSLIDRSLEQAAFAAVPAVLTIALLLRLGPALDRLALGEEVAQSLGDDVARLRLMVDLPHRARRRRLRRDLRGDRLHRPDRADLRAAADPRPSRPGDPARRR